MYVPSVSLKSVVLNRSAKGVSPSPSIVSVATRATSILAIRTVLA